MSAKLLYIFLIISVAVPSFSLDREISVDISGFKAFCPSVEACVFEPSREFKWIESRRYYSLGIRSTFRDYPNDIYGTYISALIYGSLGRLDCIDGLIGMDIVAGVHHSRINRGYEYTDILAGFRVNIDYTFWLDREYFGFSGSMLTDGDILVSWGEIRSNPYSGLRLGAGIYFDQNLSRWGDPVPFIEPPCAPNRYDYGINYFFTIGYIFKID